MNKFSLIRLIFYSPLFYILRIYSSTSSSILYNKVDWQRCCIFRVFNFSSTLTFLDYSGIQSPKYASRKQCLSVCIYQRVGEAVAENSHSLATISFKCSNGRDFFCKFPQIPAKKLLGNLNSHHHLNLSKCPQYILISLLNQQLTQGQLVPYISAVILKLFVSGYLNPLKSY